MLVPCAAYSSALKVEARFSETSADFHQTTWRYITEDRTLHSHCCDNLKSYKTQEVPGINYESAFLLSLSMKEQG
jgi:hypothetical protein